MVYFLKTISFLLVLSEYSDFKIVIFCLNKSEHIQRKSQIIHIIILALLSKINQSHQAQMSGDPK